MKAIRSVLRVLPAMVIFLLPSVSAGQGTTDMVYDCLSRLTGRESRTIFELAADTVSSSRSWFAYTVRDGKVAVRAACGADLARGAYTYLSRHCDAIVSWSGDRIEIPEDLPAASDSVSSPFQFRYYMNPVTHGYSTPYWDWERWQKEIDWMAVHGINMALISGAHEAILERVFKKAGLGRKDIKSFFCSPAYLPWNRMGNITGFGAPIPDSYIEYQVTLTHQIINRMRGLGMEPVIPSFAGFVPQSFSDLFPEETVHELKWGGFGRENHGWMLDPRSDLFRRLASLYIEEWEAEFGKGKYFLADCFNEMIPQSDGGEAELQSLLAGYGKAVYESLAGASSDAVWVMQGWTFPYMRDSDAKLFWSPDRLKALLSEVPDDGALILDITNEYSRLWWKSEPAYVMYDGFFGKRWVLGFIPVMGGHVPYNGMLQLYATVPAGVLDEKNSPALVGIGFAPEGIENNDIIYELLSDVAWSRQAVDLDDWLTVYCIRRYGSCPPEMKRAYDLLIISAYGNFTDDAIFRYQFGPVSKRKASVCRMTEFRAAAFSFLSASSRLKESELYRNDLIEITSQYLGLKADEMLEDFMKRDDPGNFASLDKALAIMSDIDRLLESHPTHRLELWLSYAANTGRSAKEKRYYLSDALRLITYWGGETREITDYSARTWSGLIRDYYIPRWKFYYRYPLGPEPSELYKWEEKWVNRGKITPREPFSDVTEAAEYLLSKY